MVGVNMYLYGCVSLLPPKCARCPCVCVISNQSTSKKPHCVSDLGKLDALLHITHINVLRLDMSRSIISLSKIAHQMRQDQPFNQGKKTTEGAVGVGVGSGSERRLGGWTKFEKVRGRQCRGSS